MRLLILLAFCLLSCLQNTDNSPGQPNTEVKVDTVKVVDSAFISALKDEILRLEYELDSIQSGEFNSYPLIVNGNYKSNVISCSYYTSDSRKVNTEVTFQIIIEDLTYLLSYNVKNLSFPIFDQAGQIMVFHMPWNQLEDNFCFSDGCYKLKNISNNSFEMIILKETGGCNILNTTFVRQ